MSLNKILRLLLLITTMLLSPLAARAISGYYSDPGGGQYWCNVFVANVSDSKSYSWCTGDDEDASMDLFRGFECEHDAKVTTEHPTFKVKYRYHHPQSKDYNYNGSDHEIYVMVHGGGLYKILEWKSGAANWTQTDFSFGVIGDLVREGEWFSFRFAPNVRAGDILKEVNIYSINGKLIDKFTTDNNEATFSVSHLIDGVSSWKLTPPLEIVPLSKL